MSTFGSSFGAREVGTVTDAGLSTMGASELREGVDPALYRRRLVAELERRGVLRHPWSLLERRGPWYVDTTSGNLLRPVAGDALHGHSGMPDAADAAYAYFVDDDGLPVLLERPSELPFTLQQLEAAEQAREHAQLQRDEQHAAFVKAQRRLVFTFDDLEPGRRTMTLREAHDVIVELGGTIEPSAHGFRITVPARYGADDGTDLGARERVREAARVLDHARELVRDRLRAGRPLPDQPPAVGGG